MSETLESRVARVVHCDWGTAPAKRRMAIADRSNRGWRARSVEEVGPCGTLLSRLRGGLDLASGATLVGFDFPIGIPVAFAKAAGLASFHALLTQLDRPGEWADFHKICETASELSLRRPFYPKRAMAKGTSTRDQQYTALSLGRGALLRRCDHITEAEQMFWTLGPKQVGRGALIGWREVLAPGLGSFRAWPFDGELSELLAPGAVVVAETYPAEFYRHLGLAVVKSDGRSRARAGVQISAWAARNNVELDVRLRSDVECGFASDDDFDAAVGLFGMVNVLRGHRAEGRHRSCEVAPLEGWILGAIDLAA